MSVTRVLVCGSRNADVDSEIVDQCISEIIEDVEESSIEFVSGGAKGGDALGEEYAKLHGFPIVYFRPDWKTYGRAAGPIRNQQMVEYVDECENPIVIAFWDGQSAGTRNTIKLAQNKGIYVNIIRYENDADSITAGIQLNGDSIVVDWDEDDPDDILPLVSQKIVQSKKNGHAYYHAFKANKADKETWSKFLDILKHSTDETTLRQITDKIASKLIRTYNEFDCILYPDSASKLNQCMIDSLHSIDPYIPAYSIGKSSPKNVGFDWDTFRAKSNVDDPKYAERCKRIEQMMNRIHKSDRFSMQKHTNSYYRKYVTDFLEIEDLEPALNDITMSQTILILDDIITSGSTVTEMIRMLDNLGYEGDIVIFSLVYNK